MKRRVILQPPAEADIAAAHAWIAGHSPHAAIRWLDELLGAIESLEEFPDRCATAPESEEVGRTIRHLVFGEYRVLFIVEPREVRILHIRHGARRLLSAEEF